MILLVYIFHLAILKKLSSTKLLNKLKSDCAIINTSRGDLINENDLIFHLNENKNFYAGLDVFNPEPPHSKNELLKLKIQFLHPTQYIH